MKCAIAGAVLAVVAGGVACGWAADEPAEFEVASIKPAPARLPGAPQGTMGCFGGPGSRDPGRYTCANASVTVMVLAAYGLKPYQVSPPFSSDTVLYNVEAKVVPGATAEQVHAMLRSLLAERFKLAFHREKAELPGFAMVVAKGGVKIREAAPDAPPVAEGTAAPAPQGATNDADGFRYFARRNALAVGYANGLARWVGMNVAMDSADNRAPSLTGLLNSLTGSPVVDGTGLAGKYDFVLTFSPEAAGGGSRPVVAPASQADEVGADAAVESGLTVFAAVEKQLGLRLEARKVPVERVVIDHVEKAPVEN